jgi:hypothetical protein
MIRFSFLLFFASFLLTFVAASQSVLSSNSNDDNTVHTYNDWSYDDCGESERRPSLIFSSHEWECGTNAPSFPQGRMRTLSSSRASLSFRILQHLGKT